MLVSMLVEAIGQNACEILQEEVKILRRIKLAPIELPHECGYGAAVNRANSCTSKATKCMMDRLPLLWLQYKQAESCRSDG